MTNNQIHATEVTNQSIPIAISARHCHVNEEDFYYLFGRDAALQKWKELSQPGHIFIWLYPMLLPSMSKIRKS
ncbi:PduL/EutD family phosphate acyltransferase [Lysinibacillus capsici]